MKIKPEIEPISRKIISDLIHAASPCITVLLPPYRPGERGKPPAARLKVDLQEAAKRLAARRVAAPLIVELLDPLYELAQQEQSLGGSGLAQTICRSAEVFRQFELPVPPSPGEACVVGDCFWIRPAFRSLALPPKIYILELTKKSVALMVCGLNGTTRIGLPKGTPQTLEEALGFDAPDHDLINRSASGPSTGAMRGVQFGTGSGRETQHAYLHDFYRAIDRGINEFLGNPRKTECGAGQLPTHSAVRGAPFPLLPSNQATAAPAPLILTGVDEDMAIYRSINTYSNLLEQGIHGSPGSAMPDSQMLRHAHDIASFSGERRVALEMAISKERLGPARFSVDLKTILRVAAEKRVSDLYLDESAQRLGTFDGKIFGGSGNWHDEDLLNVAAVETLRGRGVVHSLPTHWMPRGAVAAAAFRF